MAKKDGIANLGAACEETGSTSLEIKRILRLAFASDPIKAFPNHATEALTSSPNQAQRRR